ncbi:MAG TPA: hypothetical protein VME40_01350 [Caulobacteraceae bacterium]|nr:hypothetical protein [Caulobacteraceae bacterium]
MRRRALLAALPLGLAAGVALAQDKEAGQYVDLAPVAMPIVVDNHLVNYVFVYIRINLTPAANLEAMRDKEPYFRDALIKLGHRTPFTLPSDYTRLDEGRLKASLYQAAVAIAGPGAIANVQILPGGAPMHRTGLPRPQVAGR